jgi:hypothetical protein
MECDREKMSFKIIPCLEYNWRDEDGNICYKCPDGNIYNSKTEFIQINRDNKIDIVLDDIQEDK